MEKQRETGGGGEERRWLTDERERVRERRGLGLRMDEKSSIQCARIYTGCGVWQLQQLLKIMLLRD